VTTNAVLLRDVPLVVRDVSSGGCLIESRGPLRVGTIGRLEVEYEGRVRFEWFRISRVRECGEQAFVSGVEFLPLAAAGTDSLRSAIGRLRPAPSDNGSPEVAGPSSSDTGNSGPKVASAVAQSTPTTPRSPRKIVDFFRRR
jgi:hypothetical protein